MRRWPIAIAAAIVLSACSTSPSVVVSPSPVVSAFPAAGSSSVSRQALPPARTLPVIALCSQPVTILQDANAAPLLCANGALNILAWKHYVPISPRIFLVGATASLVDVQTAIRRDMNIAHASPKQERSAYELAAAYYGWNFSSDPTANL